VLIYRYYCEEFITATALPLAGCSQQPVTSDLAGRVPIGQAIIVYWSAHSKHGSLDGATLWNVTTLWIHSLLPWMHLLMFYLHRKLISQG